MDGCGAVIGWELLYDSCLALKLPSNTLQHPGSSLWMVDIHHFILYGS